jgi:hypothetical protein
LPCKRFLEGTVAGKGPAACTDAEVLQEILHRYRSLKLPEIGFKVFDGVTDLGIQILPITEGSLREARALLEDNPSLSTRNGVHLGVMREHVRRRGRRSHGGGGAEAAGLVSSWKGTKRGAES